MALILPASYSTFGDSTSTSDGPLRTYVLAQFRSDSDLGWVADLRAALASDELKYKVFAESRIRLKGNADLWKVVMDGLSRATIVVVDPKPVAESIRQAWLIDGGREGEDFGNSEVIQGSALALIAGTPVAHLPSELIRTFDPYAYRYVGTLDEFSPGSIRDQIGGGLRAASIFSARAHATFDVAVRDRDAASTRDVYRSPLASVILRELVSVARVFDAEAPITAEILNKASDEIAWSILSQGEGQSETDWVHLALSRALGNPLVSEADSRSIDHLQAADVAAGYARELLELTDIDVLPKHFGGVIVNGKILRRPDL